MAMQTMMWGGSDEPCALCQVASLGAINLTNNKAVCKDICDMLSEAPFGIKPDRTYVEFRDVPRENMVSHAPQPHPACPCWLLKRGVCALCNDNRLNLCPHCVLCRQGYNSKTFAG